MSFGAGIGLRASRTGAGEGKVKHYNKEVVASSVLVGKAFSGTALG
jgi:hypothetical protein